MMTYERISSLVDEGQVKTGKQLSIHANTIATLFSLLFKMTRFGLPIIKGLITIVIVALFFYIGRELVNLYRMPNSSNLTNVSSTFDTADGRALTVRFGNTSSTFLQQKFTGSKEDVCQALELACREMTRKSSLPTDTPGSAEAALLKTRLPQLLNEATEENIHVLRIDPQNPIVVGIRLIPNYVLNPNYSSGGGRIVCWGFATPADGNLWNIRVVSRTGNVTKYGVASIDIPPGSTKLLQMASPEGQESLAFKNDLELSEQIDHFNRILHAARWEIIRDWDLNSNHGTATFARNDNAKKQIAQIHIRRKNSTNSETETDSWWGIINMTNYNKDKDKDFIQHQSSHIWK